MVKKEDFNIFEEAGKTGKKKKKKKIYPISSQEKSDFSENPIVRKPAVAAPPAGDTEVNDMLKRLRGMDEDLQKKMQRICELSGMTRIEIESYIDNPNNFTDFQWNKIQKEKENLEEKIYSSIGIRAKKRVLLKKKKKMAKGRRGKTLGGRKGWIQM
jgi:hypothetical protein